MARAKSIREVARRLNSTSGQVSKTIQNLEKRLGIKLFRRSTAGVLLTSHGAELQALAQAMLETGERIEGLLSGKKQKLEKVLAIAGTSFLNTHFITPIVCQLSKKIEKTTFRFLDLAPDQIVAVGLRGGFEMAVHYGALSWPSTWSSESLGKSKWNLCARKDHPLRRCPQIKQILEFPFVVPTYWTQEGLVRGNDQFPIPISKRKIGFETATADAAIPILLETNQIAFLPELLTRNFVKSNQIRILKVEEKISIEKEIFLSVKSDIVPAAVFNALSDSMSIALKAST